MGIEKFLFYVFGAITVFAAFRVITSRHPVHAVLFLVLTFFSTAATWLLLEVEFLAIALVLVYVGAVMVLFLFVVMMIDINLTPTREGFARYLPLGIGIALVVVFEMVAVVGSNHFTTGVGFAEANAPAEVSNTAALGQALYTEYLYPFEIAAVILLVAIIAAITLTMRHRPDSKYQAPHEQIRTDPRRRVRLVDLRPKPTSAEHAEPDPIAETASGDASDSSS